MLNVRSLVLTEVMLVGAMVVGAVEPVLVRRAEPATKVREALSVPGTGLCVMSDAQATRLATRVDEMLQRDSKGRLGLDDFLETARLMEQTGAADAVRAFADGRSFSDVCRELGGLLLEQQRRQQEGRRPEVAVFLKELHAAREAGLAESEVRRQASEGAAQGKLAPGAEKECAGLQVQADRLVQVLVAGEVSVEELARVHGMNKAVLLSTLATGTEVMVGNVRFGWL